MATTLLASNLQGCFRTPVFTGLLFSERVGLGLYDDVLVEAIDDRTHLEQPHTARDIDFELFPQSDRHPVGDERRVTLDLNIREATICEFLAFGAAHPDVQRQVDIVLVDLDVYSGTPCTAILGCRNGRRVLRMGRNLLITEGALILGQRVLQGTGY